MMKDKMKDFVKKVTSSGTPSTFKGTSHVLGSGSPSSSSSSHPASRPTNPTPNPRPAPKQPSPPPPPASTTEFTPFTPLISTTSSASRRPDANGAADAATIACPSCGDAFRSEVAVSEHLDGCLASAGGARARAAAYLAANPPPPAAAVEVLKRLLGNLLKEPGNDKFRRVRLGNPRIKEAVADREGGVELLEAVGFRVGDEGGELFAVMDEVPGDARLSGIRRAVLLLERAHPSAPPAQAEAAAKESCNNGVDGQEEEAKKTVDRQIRVFFCVPGTSVADNDVPDSYYNLTGEEIRNEAKMRRERLEQSRLLIPKSYKEKQALAARQKYKQAVIRVQFPDRVILQGVFLPGEATGSLYEFVASALKQRPLLCSTRFSMGQHGRVRADGDRGQASQQPPQLYLSDSDGSVGPSLLGWANNRRRRRLGARARGGTARTHPPTGTDAMRHVRGGRSRSRCQRAGPAAWPGDSAPLRTKPVVLPPDLLRRSPLAAVVRSCTSVECTRGGADAQSGAQYRCEYVGCATAPVRE